MRKSITIEISAYSSHVYEAQLSEHLDYLIGTLKQRAEEMKFNDWERKVDVDWEVQEDINLEVCCLDMLTDGGRETAWHMLKERY